MGTVKLIQLSAHVPGSPTGLFGQVFSVLPFTTGTNPIGVSTVGLWAEYPIPFLRILAAIDWAIENKAHVINLSMGPLPKRHDPSDPLSIAFRECHSRGITVVVSAGNYGPKEGTLSQFAVSPDTIAVSACVGGKVDKFASRGLLRGQCPAFIADGSVFEIPGVKSQKPGTSFSAPRVAKLACFSRSLIEWISADMANVYKDKKASLVGPVSISRIAVLDTGIDFDALSDALPASPVTDLYSSPEYNKINLSSHPDWFGRLRESLSQSNSHFGGSASPEYVERFLAVCAEPVGDVRIARHGFISDELFSAMISNFRPSTFYRIFREDPKDWPDVTLAELDEEIGPLWSESEVIAITASCSDALRMLAARVV